MIYWRKFMFELKKDVEWPENMGFPLEDNLDGSDVSEDDDTGDDGEEEVDSDEEEYEPDSSRSKDLQEMHEHCRQQ